MSRIFARRRLLAVGLVIALASPLATTHRYGVRLATFDVCAQGRLRSPRAPGPASPRRGPADRHLQRQDQACGQALPGPPWLRGHRRRQRAHLRTRSRARWEAIQEARARIERKYDRIMKVARNQKGDPYVYGAAGPGAFDCSGLTRVRLPAGDRHVAAALGDGPEPQGRPHHPQAGPPRRPGVHVRLGGDIYHAAIYAGKGKILHASRPGTNVKTDPIWTSSYFIVRLLPRK